MCSETGYTAEGVELYRLHNDSLHYLKNPVYVKKLLMLFLMFSVLFKYVYSI